MSRPPASTPAIARPAGDGEDDREQRRDDGPDGDRGRAARPPRAARASPAPPRCAPRSAGTSAPGRSRSARRRSSPPRRRSSRPALARPLMPLGRPALPLLPLGALSVPRSRHQPPRSARAAGSTASNSVVAAARGSAASRIALTTQSRSAPAATTSPTFSVSIPPIANQGRVRDLGGFADQLEPGGGSPLLGGRLPDRADADVVDGLLRGRLDLLPAVGGEADDRVGAR